jgi:hypothetical protein
MHNKRAAQVEPSDSTNVTPQWGQHKPMTPTVELWESTQPILNPTPNYLHRYCSICFSPMATLNAFKTLICHECRQEIDTKKQFEHQDGRKYINEGRDDEEEFRFIGISIAGKNKGDSHDSWESTIFGHNSNDSGESEEEETSSNCYPSSKLNLKAIEDLAFMVGPVKNRIVKLHHLPPIPFTSNYYRHLKEITDYLPIMSETYRWPWLLAVSPIATNAQRLAHPWRISKREHNHWIKSHEDSTLDQQVLYINQPTATHSATTRPAYFMCHPPKHDIRHTQNHKPYLNHLQRSTANAIDRKLLKLYNIFPPIDIPTTKPMQKWFTVNLSGLASANI